MRWAAGALSKPSIVQSRQAASEAKTGPICNTSHTHAYTHTCTHTHRHTYLNEDVSVGTTKHSSFCQAFPSSIFYILFPCLFFHILIPVLLFLLLCFFFIFYFCFSFLSFFIAVFYTFISNTHTLIQFSSNQTVCLLRAKERQNAFFLQTHTCAHIL